MKKQLTKKQEKALALIQDSKQLENAQKINHYIDAASLVEDMARFIKATKQRRLLCVIENASGSKRDLRYFEFNTKQGRGGTYNFWSLFVFLGYKESKKSRDLFTIHGGGMDMNFNTHYNIIYKLKSYGLLTAKETEALCQMSPSIV